jgi:hypothetical protein
MDNDNYTNKSGGTRSLSRTAPTSVTEAATVAAPAPATACANPPHHGEQQQIVPESGWRVMLGLAALPGLVMFHEFLSLPESPRWLAQKGRIAEAEKVLQSLRESDGETSLDYGTAPGSLAPVARTQHPDSDSNVWPGTDSVK